MVFISDFINWVITLPPILKIVAIIVAVFAITGAWNNVIGRVVLEISDRMMVIFAVVAVVLIFVSGPDFIDQIVYKVSNFVIDLIDKI